MKMVKFNNQSNIDVLGMPIYINCDKIISIFEEDIGGTLRTVIYGENNNSWFVEESLSEVIKIIEESK